MNIQSLKSTARQRLNSAAYCPGRLMLLHTGAAVALLVILTVIDYLLNRQMGSTAGLSGIGTRSVLLSAQAILSLAVTAAMPFWQCGIRRAALQISRNEPATPTTLLEGFRRYGVVLRMLLLRIVTCIVISIVCLQAATMVFMATPLSNDFMEAAMALMATNTVIDDAVVDSLMPMLKWVYVIWIALASLILIPMLYRYRLADWAAMDDADRARAAFKQSKRLTFFRRLQLLKLDLHFWWYYGLQILTLAVAYGERLLPALGISMNETVAFFGFYLASQLLQLLIAWRFAPLVYTTYAATYDEFKELANRQFELKVEN